MAGFLQTGFQGGAGQQYTPFGVNGVMGNTAFSGNIASQNLSPQQTTLGQQFGTQIMNNMTGPSANYNPNTSFLPGQYAGIYGPGGMTSGANGTAGYLQNYGAGLLNSNTNFNNNVNNLFGSQVAAQTPYINQFLQSNADNEFSKGTLASTAGAYQTMGADQSVQNNLNSMYGNAFNQALNQYQTQGQLGLNSMNAGGQMGLTSAANQFGAANNTQQMNEAQAEFGPQFATGQTQGLFQNLMGQQNMLNNQLQTGGTLGGLQANANQNPNAQTQAASSLLNGLLFGNGSGGLLGSLLGTGGNSSGGAGGLIGSLLGGTGNGMTQGPSGALGYLQSLFGGNSQANNNSGLNALNNFGGSGTNDMSSANQAYYGDPSQDFSGAGSAGSGVLANNDTSGLATDFLNSEGSFSGAGGQAATGAPDEAGLFDSALGSQGQGGLLSSLQQGGSSLGSVLGAYNGLTSGNPVGEASGAIKAANVANQYGAFGGDSSTVGAGLGAAGAGLGLYSGIEQGGVTGDTQAAVSAAQLANEGAAAAGLESGSTAAGIGSALGALAPILGVSLYALSTPSYTLNGDYYNNMKGYINAGPGAYASTKGWEANNSIDPQYTDYYTAEEALGLMPNGSGGVYTDTSNPYSTIKTGSGNAGPANTSRN